METTQIADPADLVEIQTLNPGCPFRYDDLEGHWIYGHMVFANASRARAVIHGDQPRHPKDEESNLPLGMLVESLADPDDSKPKRRSEPMPTNPKAAGLIARYQHQQKQWAIAQEAGDASKVEVCLSRITAIEAEAKEAGVELPAYDSDRPTHKVEPAGLPITSVTTVGKGKVQTARPPLTKAQKDDIQAATRAKAKAAAITAKAAAKADKPKGEQAPKKLKATHDCICGCQRETGGLYAPGHDARIKGMLLKIERGDLPKDMVPPAVAPFVKWRGTWKTDAFCLVAAPVKFPGRDDIENTTQEALEALDV